MCFFPWSSAKKITSIGFISRLALAQPIEAGCEKGSFASTPIEVIISGIFNLLPVNACIPCCFNRLMDF